MLSTDSHKTQFVIGDLAFTESREHQTLAITIRLWREQDAFPVNGCATTYDLPKPLQGLDCDGLRITAQRSLDGTLAKGGFYGFDVVYRDRSEALDLSRITRMAKTLSKIAKAQEKAGDAHADSWSAVLSAVITALGIKHWLVAHNPYSSYSDTRWTVRSVAAFQFHLAEEIAMRTPGAAQAWAKHNEELSGS